MANTNDYKPIANGGTANVESQAQYVTDLAPAGSLQNGYLLGKALSKQVNKTLRQASMIAAAVAQMISDVLVIDVLDDGDLPALVTNLKAALANLSWTTGDLKMTLKVVADTGWIMCDDGTIGSAASTATHAAAANQALFLFLWNNIPDAYAPVVTGRGGAAAADWAANKKITLTKMLGRALGVAGGGAGLTNRPLGSIVGEEAHALIAAENGVHAHGVNDPTHSHGISDPGHAHGVGDPTHAHASGTYNTDGGGNLPMVGTGPGGGSSIDTGPAGTGIGIVAAATGVSANVSGTGVSIQTSGGGAAHNTMQPTGFVNVMIKL